MMLLTYNVAVIPLPIDGITTMTVFYLYHAKGPGTFTPIPGYMNLSPAHIPPPKK